MSEVKILRPELKGTILFEKELKWKYEDKGVAYPKAYVLRDEAGDLYYQIEEPELDEKQIKIISKLKKTLYYVIKPSSNEDEMIQQILFHPEVKGDPKIGYYIYRDVLRYGPLSPLFDDEDLEDISYSGSRTGLYGDSVWVFHREFGSWLPTNIHLSKAEADYLIQRIVLKSGKSVTLARPIVDGITPEGYRFAVTYGSEVSLPGSTITIRKPLEEVWTLSDLVYKRKTLSPLTAAALWYTLENRGVVLVVGRTGTGKTTFINALMTVLPPTWKIVTVEEVPELKVIFPNWTRLIARKSTAFMEYSEAIEIPLDKLIAHTLRIRPDFVSVGEVRTKEEIKEFIHSVASGHGGVTSLHAEDFDSLKARFNYSGVDDSFFALVTMVVFINTYPNPEKRGGLRRRVQEAGEILLKGGQATYNQIVFYNPIVDSWDDSKIVISERLLQIAQRNGLTQKDLEEELKARVDFLKYAYEKDFSLNQYKEGLMRFYEARGIV
ncbi:type II/IV secretion system ATPase subunit [Sulfurisphaera ohwakuensis]|uniref:Flagellar protein FlaI n=1 Tax=Sulfurisphaera ohwakuensis TaxID=69656 RepID=A0A650CGP2_SULOH|nr:type II/IV secretion system ATPase subunit [Sulfurisphaera ohwakuensis]MBB5252640.1 flagellar protein FlaI [Sulfurisphaera ohwakuensis]QGR16926.1 secretion system protein E [Sulfurisphaera ohwakuensis]